MTYLALKHKAPDGFWRAVFHYLTKARLLTEYPHAGIVKEGMLMHTTLTNGLHSVAFDPDGWHLFPRWTQWMRYSTRSTNLPKPLTQWTTV